MHAVAIWRLADLSARSRTQVNNFTFHYAFYVVMNWLPTYFDKVLKANLAELGPVKTLPYLIMFAMSNVGNLCGDWLITAWQVVRRRGAQGGQHRRCGPCISVSVNDDTARQTVSIHRNIMSVTPCCGWKVESASKTTRGRAALAP